MNLPVIYDNPQAEIHTDFLIRIVDDEGKTLVETFGFGSVYSYNEFLRQNFPMTEEDVEGTKFKVFTLPPLWLGALGILKPRKKNPLKCNYIAVKNYLSSLYGVNLSSEDEEFFETHPCVQADGVPMQDTLRVMQELVEPYGFKISRVQMMPGVSASGDLLQWRKILGVNPKALADKGTTNAEWRKEVPDDVTEYNFEYSVTPLRPSITCAVLADPKAQQVMTGLSHGHATYTAPRGKLPQDSVMLSVQLERAHAVHWRAEPKYAEVENGEKNQQEPIALFELSKVWTYGTKGYKTTYAGGQGSGTTGRYCYICKSMEVGSRSVTAGNPPGVCQKCWTEQLKVARCKDRNCLGSQESSWEYLSHSKDSLDVTCSFCKKAYVIEAIERTFTKPVYRILDAIGKQMSFSSGGHESRRTREVLPVTKGGELPSDVPPPPAPPPVIERDFWIE